MILYFTSSVSGAETGRFWHFKSNVHVKHFKNTGGHSLTLLIVSICCLFLKKPAYYGYILFLQCTDDRM